LWRGAEGAAEALLAEPELVFHGFAVADPPGMTDKLAGYGPDARYMVRRLIY
jgi:hypothetical protein